jgi:hypothetical protein
MCQRLFHGATIGTRSNALNPCYIGLIPVNGGGKPFIESNGGAPSQLRFGLGAVDRITAIVTRAVSDVLNQTYWLAAEPQDRALLPPKL